MGISHKLCACTLFPSSRRVRRPEYDVKLLAGLKALKASPTACWLQGLVPREGNKGWAKHPPGPSLGSSRTNLLSRGRKRALAHSITRTRGFAVGSGPVPPCRCRGPSTGARDRIRKSSLYSTAALAPVPSVVPPVGLQLGSHLGVWGLRLERLP